MSDKLPEKIVSFTTLKIEFDRKKICQCENPTYTIDYKNRLVTCAQCGTYTDPFDALYSLAMKKHILHREAEALLQQRREIEDYKPHMVVFRELEQRYRKRKGYRMLPRCPNCGDCFRFEDICGWVNECFVNRKDENSGK